ncbi:MAG TPA: excinuclease ABC subunit UvrA [Haloferula sp.]
MDSIRIRGARQHNLRGIDVEIPRGKLVVITGPSGSGKSSLAFHTLFAEGQRRFVESLSAYARQFLDQLEKPDVDAIEGLSPAIAIEQRSGGLNPRSTVATVTEIHEHLRVLWAAAGVPHDPSTGEKLERMGAADIVAAISAMTEGTKVVLLAPVPEEEAREPERLIGDLRRQGFVRVRVDGEILELEEALKSWPEVAKSVEVVVDRIVVRPGGEARLADSVETALRICGTEARALISEDDAWKEISFQTSYRSASTGFMLGELTPRHFSFNSHLGACPACEGLGTERFCDPALLLGDENLPLKKGGIKGWWKAGAQREKAFAREVIPILAMCELPESARFEELPEEGKALLFHGGELDTGWRIGTEKKKQIKKYEGLCVEAERKLRDASSEAVRRRLLRVMAERPCRACLGRRLRPEILAVRIEGNAGRWLGIQDFCELPVEEADGWLAGLRLPEDRAEVCGQLASGVAERLGFLKEVGLGYLGLDRSSATLSGGEAQRIRLATQLGSGLTGVLYVLDEPSIGLHAEDTGKLIAALKRLRDRGNTVVVVEHDEEMIRAADWMIELGPGAGKEGGALLASGQPESFPESSPTKRWLESPLPEAPKEHWFPLSGNSLVVRGASEHNLQNLDVRIPLGGIVCLSGPSGSGKSTLADDVLLRALKRHFNGGGDPPGRHRAIEGMGFLGKVVAVDQSPIGRSPRSNPATFTGMFDGIRELYSKLPLSRQRGYGAGRFSFNTHGGRCENCEGAGRLKIEMNFLPDAWITCRSCGGKRFNRETLEVRFKGMSISDALDLTAGEALAAFAAVPKLRRTLEVLGELGLGYLRLGQAANTLSGGEAQRLKLAVELSKPAAPHTLYFFDEPTTGLHFGDVDRLLTAFRGLREAGHSVLVVEHHLDVIAAADWVIDLGPGGGREGGCLVAEGTPLAIAKIASSPTGRALAQRSARHFQTKG